MSLLPIDSLRWARGDRKAGAFAGRRGHARLGASVMGCSEAQAWDRLRSMKDPVSRCDIVSLGLVKRLGVAGADVTVDLMPTGGDAYRDEALAAAIQRELGTLDGVERVVVTGGPRGAGDRRATGGTVRPR